MKHDNRKLKIKKSLKNTITLVIWSYNAQDIKEL